MNTLHRFRRIGALIGFYLALIAVMIAAAEFVPFATAVMPIDGQRLHIGLPAAMPPAAASLDLLDTPAAAMPVDPLPLQQPVPMTPGERTRVALTLLVHILATLVLMVPLTRVYMSAHHRSHDQGFIAALMLAPICVTGVVMLIQDSLPLAFGLAALVAAVRFQIRLRTALDGIFMFAAICVALSSGVGYIGIAIVISAVFCMTCIMIFELGYGAPPLPIIESHLPCVEGIQGHEHNHDPN